MALCELGFTGPCRSASNNGDHQTASTGGVAVVTGWWRQPLSEKKIDFSDRPILGVGLQRRQKRSMAGIVPDDTVLRIDWRFVQVTEHIMMPWLCMGLSAKSAILTDRQFAIRYGIYFGPCKKFRMAVAGPVKYRGAAFSVQIQPELVLVN
jgi:hypothetical protein